jgi:hypothetical protein
MGAGGAWAGGVVGSVAVLVSVYIAVGLRIRRNEHVISFAVAAMRASMDVGPAAQRVLLGAVADTLAAQERAAARIEAVIRECALRGQRAPEPEELLRELLGLPEPQLLVAGFLAEHGGARGADAAFTAIAAGLVRAAAAEVFADLDPADVPELDRILLLTADGQIAPVARAGLAAATDLARWPYRSPQLADLDGAATTALAQALDSTARRYLRLATVLHGQAEARLRPRPGEPDSRGGRTRLLVQARWLVRLPQARPPAFEPADLARLEIAFDAVGEVIDLAGEHLAAGQLASAVQLLAGLRLPVPAGLPGRMYHQESLAQARPLAALGTWHRLAVARSAAAALRALAAGEWRVPVPLGASPEADGRRSGEQEW